MLNIKMGALAMMGATLALQALGTASKGVKLPSAEKVKLDMGYYNNSSAANYINSGRNISALQNNK